MNPSLEWGSKKELYRDVRRCKTCRESASLASIFCICLARLWRPSVFSCFFGPPLPCNIRPEHLIVRMARIPVPKALWSSHGGGEFVIHTTAFRHPQPMPWPRIQCLDDLCRPQPKAKDKTCGVTSKSLGNDLGSASSCCLCSWSASSWWSWWYCWNLACQILSQCGWVPTPSGEFQRGFYLYLFKFHLLETLQAKCTYNSRCSLHRWRLKTSILHDLRGFEAWR